MGLSMTCIVLSGCAPRFVEEPRNVRRSWVERDVVVEDILGSAAQREVVHALDTGEPRISPMDRVRWVRGIDVNSSRIQRASERNLSAEADLTTNNDSRLVQYTQFGVEGDQLSVSGKMALQNFQPVPTQRYVVEFLHKNEVDALSINLMTSVWNNIAKELIKKGVKRENIIMGGSKYRQEVDAIILIAAGS